MNRILLKYFLFLTLSFSSLFGYAEVEIPELNNRPIVDLANLIPENQEKAFNRELMAFADSTGSQIVIFTFNSLDGDAIENVGIQAAEKWKIGRGGIDDGVIILVAKDDRKMRIEVGYGLEGALTDALSKRIIENVMKPNFRNGQFYLGLHEATQVIISVINGEGFPEGSSSEMDTLQNHFTASMLILIFANMFFSIFFTGMIDKTKIAMLVTFIGGLIIGGVFFSLIKGIISGVITALIRSKMDFNDPGTLGGGGSGGYGGWIIGGGSGFGSSGGFGGGFSGGGGGFGGGGASGGW